MKPLLQIKHVMKSYQGVKAVNDISFTVEEGRCLGIVGESGSGKSTLAKLILGLEKPESGEILLQGAAFHSLKGRALKEARKHVQVVFQNPAASLNERLPLWKIVVESLENYPEVVPEFLSHVRHEKREMAAILLEMVGLNRQMLDRYPHELSGGQKQRVAIARGLSLQPKLLICDEPTSSLDVSVQAQILNVLKDLQGELNMSYVFISHDLAAVQFMSDEIAVLKDGQLVDFFQTEELFAEERHPYTKSMLEAIRE